MSNQTVALPTSGGFPNLVAWDLVLTTPINITAGQVYTFEILDAASVPGMSGTSLATTIPRLPGTSYYSTMFGLNISDASGTYGLAFKTWVASASGGSISTAGSITAGSTLTAGSVTYPSAHGTAGQVLTTTGSGTLTFTTVSGGGSSISVGTITSTSNVNGASITSGVLNLAPANATNGGVVSTGTQSFAGNKTILGTLNVSTLNSGETTDVNNTATTPYGVNGTTQWQSFTAGVSGALTKITVYGSGSYTTARNGTLTIYSGVGNGGTQLSTQSVALPTGFAAWDLVLTSPINITAGQVYTFQISDPASVAPSGSSYAVSNRIVGSSYYTNAFGLNFSMGGVNFGLSFKTWVASASGGSISTAGSISAGSTLTAGSVTYPSAHGTAGQVLTTTGSGTLTFTTVSGGGSSISVGTITSTSNVNGASITSGVLNLAPANATNGGVVSTGTQSFAGNKTILGTLNVSTLNSGETTDVNNTATTPYGVNGTTQWQSFTAGVSGALTKITVYGSGSYTTARNGTLTIYSGVGNGGTQLSTQSVALPTGFAAWDLVLTSPINITAGQVYTFQISDPASVAPSGSSYAVSNRIVGSSYYTNAFGLNFSMGGVNFGLSFKTWVASASGGSISTAGSISAGSTLTAGSVTYPSAHGTAGQVLTTTGSGTLTFTTNNDGIHTLGESYGGGIVFYVYDGGKHGLIGATVDQSVGANWEDVSGEKSAINGIRDGINAGAMNTERIINFQGNAGYAAQLSANYNGGNFGDWYLPSKYELNLLWLQKGLFSGSWQNDYWTSTESSATNAWAQYFPSGFQYGDHGKNATKAVRAIRAF